MNKMEQRRQNAMVEDFIRKQILKGNYGYCCYSEEHGAQFYVYSLELKYLKGECHWAFANINISDSAIREAIQRVTVCEVSHHGTVWDY